VRFGARGVPPLPQPFGFQNGGMIWPRRAAMIIRMTPVVVHSRKAMSEDSTPNAPPVSSVGPSTIGLMRPGSVIAARNDARKDARLGVIPRYVEAHAHPQSPGC